MNDKLDFMVYCMEYYKQDKKMTGAQTDPLFSKCGALDYVKSCYGALHTTPPRYIVEDIDAFILSHKPKNAQENPH